MKSLIATLLLFGQVFFVPKPWDYPDYYSRLFFYPHTNPELLYIP